MNVFFNAKWNLIHTFYFHIMVWKIMGIFVHIDKKQIRKPANNNTDKHGIRVIIGMLCYLLKIAQLLEYPVFTNQHIEEQILVLQIVRVIMAHFFYFFSLLLIMLGTPIPWIKNEWTWPLSDPLTLAFATSVCPLLLLQGNSTATSTKQCRFLHIESISSSSSIVAVQEVLSVSWIIKNRGVCVYM